MSCVELFHEERLACGRVFALAARHSAIIRPCLISVFREDPNICSGLAAALGPKTAWNHQATPAIETVMPAQQ